jgi:hypothetical protein
MIESEKKTGEKPKKIWLAVLGGLLPAIGTISLLQQPSCEKRRSEIHTWELGWKGSEDHLQGVMDNLRNSDKYHQWAVGVRAKAAAAAIGCECDSFCAKYGDPSASCWTQCHALQTLGGVPDPDLDEAATRRWCEERDTSGSIPLNSMACFLPF